MKKVIVNYANSIYKETQAYNTYTAFKKGKADEVFSFSQNDIDDKFFNSNKKILSIKRGNGLWLWKPYFVKKALNSIDYGDVLFYTDSGCYFKKNIDKLLKKVTDFEIICFDLPLIEEQFTKKETLEKMNCTSDRYTKTKQIMATYFIIRKTKFTESFIDEWLEQCCNYDLISPSDELNENKNFISHREDQSIFSLLCKKYNIKPYNDISQIYYFPKLYKEKKYIYVKNRKHTTKKLPVILFLHKKPNVRFLKMMKYRLKLILSLFK